MKTLKILPIVVLVLLLGQQNIIAQKEYSTGIGMSLKVSTNGFGTDVIYNFYKNMGVRLGFEMMGFKKGFNFEDQTVEYAADLKYRTGSISLLFDYYVAKSVFFSAGAGYNLFRTVITGKAADGFQYGDIQIPAEKIGTFEFLIEPSWKVSPYLGVGFGRTLGPEKKVAFAFEMGAFYQGSPDISIKSDGIISPTSNPYRQHDLKLEKQINQYRIYPVLRLSVSYNIFSF